MLVRGPYEEQTTRFCCQPSMTVAVAAAVEPADGSACGASGIAERLVAVDSRGRE